MKKLTKILSVILCLAMLMGLATVAFAEEEAKTYTKVTADQEDWSGTYLLVYEETSVAFNSGLATIDAANNNVAVTISGNQITTSENIAVTVEKVDGGYVMKAANGKYFYGKSGDNKLQSTTDKTVADDYPVSFAFVEGELDIVSATSHFRYNPSANNYRFRFFKAATYANQKAVAMYKLDGTASGGGEGSEGGEGNEPEQPVGPTEVTIPEAVAIGEANSSYTTELYKVTGTIALIENAAYGNMYIIDEQGNHLYLYGLNDEAGNRYDAMTDKPDEGDTITVVGPLGNYKGTAQMKPATLISYTAGEAPEVEELTIAEAIAKAPTAKIYTKYLVRGKIVEVKDLTYGNMYIEDEDGNKLYIYGLYSKDGTTRYDKMETKPQVGDEILVLGALTTYNDAPQMKNGWLQEHKVAEQETPIPDPVEVTIPEANAIGEATNTTDADAEYTAEKYIVTGVITEVTNDIYGNVYIEDEDGNKLYIYGLYDEDSNRYDKMDPQPAVGDTITVVGVLGNYKGSAQMQNGVVTAHTPGEPSETGDPILVAVCALLVSGGAVAILPKKREF